MSKESIDSIEFKLGQLTGQVLALTASMQEMITTIKSIETRMNVNEKDTTKLSVKMSFIGATAGILGSGLMSIIQQIISSIH
jgi:hypothetical protein